MVIWEEFPPEVRLLILENLARAVLADENDVLTDYSAVCSEWRDLAERQLYQNITISQRDLVRFDRYVRGPRRKWLKHLRLNVKLPLYNSKRVGMNDLEKNKQKNDDVFTKAVWDLFETLSKWTKEEVWQDGDLFGVKLEVSALSPSDEKEFRIHEMFVSEGPTYKDSYLDFDFSQVPEFLAPHGLPSVSVVTGLCILRRNRRYYDPFCLLAMLSSLTQLQYFIFEPWQQEFIEGEMEFDRDLASIIPFLAPSLPHLKTVRIFEVPGPYRREEEGGRNELPALSDNLRALSLQLDHFLCSNCADARSFFRPFYKPTHHPAARLPHWPALEMLTMTSATLAPTQVPDAINELIAAAGRAARQMPRLKLLELYNVEKRDVAVFGYRNDNELEPPQLRWLSSWDFEVSKAARKVWEDMVRDVVVRRALKFRDMSALARDFDEPQEVLPHGLVTFSVLMHP